MTDYDFANDENGRVIEMTDAETDALLAAMDADDPGAAASDVLAGMAAADNRDPVAELDADLADYQPFEADKYQMAEMQQTDRDEYLARGVPSTLVELGLPLLYSASARVRMQGAQILDRAEGVDPDSHAFNRIAVALRDLLADNGLRPNVRQFDRARREDNPSISELNDMVDERFGTTQRLYGAQWGDGTPLDARKEERKAAERKLWRAARERDRQRAAEIGYDYD